MLPNGKPAQFYTDLYAGPMKDYRYEHRADRYLAPGAGPAHVPLERVHHVLFAVRLAQGGGEHAEPALGHPHRLADALDLAGVFDRPLRLHHPVHRDERHLRGQGLERLQLAQRDPVALDAHVPGTGLRQHLGRRFEGGLVVPADDRVEVRALLLDLLLEPRVADEGVVLRQGREVARVAGEPGQVRDVHRGGDEETVEALCPEGLPDGGAALELVVHAMERGSVCGRASGPGGGADGFP